MADINVVGVVAIVVFYMLILGIGLWAAWRRKEGEEEAMLAGRSIGMVVGTFTLTGNFKMNRGLVFQPVIIANRLRGKRFLTVLIDTCYKSSLSTDLLRVIFPLRSDSVTSDFPFQAITRANMLYVF